MSDKKPTISSQRREIERLKARIEVLEQKMDKDAFVIRERLYDAVDANMKISQAMAILRGDDQ